MSKLEDRIDVACPFHYLIHHALRFFTVHRRGQTPGTVTLKLDAAQVGLPAKVRASHDVRMQYEKRKSAERGDFIALTWDPDDRYVPTFTGELYGEKVESGGSRLVLTGSYEAPMGRLGAVFDAVLGKRIAAASAQALLKDIKDFVEADYETARTTSLASSPKE